MLIDRFLGGGAADPQLHQALQMTQHEMFRVSQQFGQAMAWETVHVDDMTIVDTSTMQVIGKAHLGQRPWGVTTAPAKSS